MRAIATGALLLGAVPLAGFGCGDDGASGDGSATHPINGDSTGKPGCNKGEYPGDHGKLRLCGKGAECSSVEVPFEKIRGYTSYQWDVNVAPGSEPDLSALSCLESVGGLIIGGGTEMTDLKGLGNLKKASSVSIVKMPKLTSLAGLDSLTSTTEISVNFNPALTDISGLPAGLSVKQLWVTGNDNLTSIAGLADLKVTSIVSFENNKNLSECDVAAFGARFPDAKLTNSKNLMATCK
jgi:hypothetical protein